MPPSSAASSPGPRSPSSGSRSPPQTLWKFGLIACLGTGAQLCIIRSFSITEAGIVAPFAYLGIVFATFWGAVLYGQWPDRWTVIGALVIVGAGLYVWHRETRALRAP
jgi:drug/metabolite transporter (DMT)-like permease